MKNRTISEGTLFFSMTLEFLGTYMPRQLGRSPETIKSYRDSLTIFRRYLYNEKKISVGKFRFEDCTPKLIQDFIISLKESGSSPGTRNQRLTAIRTYLWFAADRDIALQSTALAISKIPLCKVTKKEKETLTEEALRCILLQPRKTKIGMRDRVMMILLYDSAIRLDELLSLTVQELMLDGKPKQKASVEGTVGKIATAIIARLRNETFYSLDTLKAAVSSSLKEFNDEPFQKRSGSRTEIFLQEEKMALRELPALPYEIAEWIYGRKVYPDCHVTYEKNHYSCPYQYVGKQVNLKITEAFIEIFHKGERLATHNKYPDYVCNAWFRQMEWDDQRIRNWAASIGSSASIVIDRIFGSVKIKEQGYNASPV